MKKSDPAILRLEEVNAELNFFLAKETDLNKKLMVEIERLKEYEWMYKDLCK